MGGGGRVAQQREKALPFRFVNHPRGCRPSGGQVVPVVALAIILAGLCRKRGRRRGTFLYILF